MAWEMVINNENKRILIKARMEINIKKKRTMRLTNLIMIKDLKVLTNVKFKTKVKDVLNL
jgi:hypothetical protein